MIKQSDLSDEDIIAMLNFSEVDVYLASWCRTYQPDLWKKLLDGMDDSKRKEFFRKLNKS